MKERKSKVLIILGCQRSGTTLLAAMLGGHSEINMLFESTTKDTLQLIGKKYSGNKLLTWRQIRWDNRSSKFGHLMNRLYNFDFGKERKHHKLRPYPTTKLSIQDYLNYDAKFITITRKKEEVVKSITSRTTMSQLQASEEYDKSMREMKYVQDIALNINFSELVNSPEKTLEKVCDFLELEFEPRMLKGPEYNFVYPSSSIDKSKSTVKV